MKHIKKFELLSDELKVGDYIMLRYEHPNKRLTDLLNNNIGNIVFMSRNKNWIRLIIPENIIPEKLKEYFVYYGINMLRFEYDVPSYSVVEYANTKEEL